MFLDPSEYMKNYDLRFLVQISTIFGIWESDFLANFGEKKVVF